MQFLDQPETASEYAKRCKRQSGHGISPKLYCKTIAVVRTMARPNNMAKRNRPFKTEAVKVTTRLISLIA